ncbi:MAG TPA: hypothetical protein VFN61_16040 [Acidimicrobiales bacterium]|nr:hypothetical protein [Acidimicrobiales bacterium]
MVSRTSHAALSQRDISRFAEAVAALLADPIALAGASSMERARWQGALAACEAILGRPSSLAPDLDLESLL